ncbi:MAG: Extracellular solute-binding protein family 1 [Parcubacteria group bacterium GW2011_GWB1_42_9]|nr:MAG: Extracellular solute-binding protein family 1 [Parcubacteria group bacterium GW2011_GWB1_42_9]
MKNLNPFQAILLVVFGFAAIIAVLVFGGFLPGFRSISGGNGGTVTVWGTLPADQMLSFWSDFNKQNEKSFQVDYVAKSSDTFEADLVEAMAEDRGPDLVFLPQELLIKQSKKLLTIPYSLISARDFQDTYFDGAEILMRSQGVVALPIWVDPLVMYYNKDLFSVANLATPPANWSAFLLAGQALTKKDVVGNILQSGVALGEPTNIKNTKEILATLFFQSGEKIITRDANDNLSVVFGTSDNSSAPASAALQFFTQFTDPNSAVYSWNRSLPEAEEAFYAGRLGMYFGFGSEIKDLVAKNPHLYFDLATVPQREKAGLRATYGRLVVLAVVSGSQKSNTAVQVAQTLAGAVNAKKIADLAGASPTRRDLLAVGDKDPKKTIIYRSAFISRSWNDPEPRRTKTIFNDAVDSLNIGRVGASTAVDSASAELQAILKTNDN